MEYHQLDIDDKVITVGLAITGSFCTFEKILKVIERLKEYNMKVIPPIPALISSSSFGLNIAFNMKYGSDMMNNAIPSIPKLIK